MPKGGTAVTRIKSEVLLRAIFSYLLDSGKYKYLRTRINWRKDEHCIFLNRVTTNELIDLTNDWIKAQDNEILSNQLVCARYPSGYIGLIGPSPMDLAIQTKKLINSNSLKISKSDLSCIFSRIVVNSSIPNSSNKKLGTIVKHGTGSPTSTQKKGFNYRITIEENISNEISSVVGIDGNDEILKEKYEKFFEYIFGISGKYDQFEYAETRSSATVKLRQDLAAIRNRYGNQSFLENYKNIFPEENCSDSKLMEFVNNLTQPDTPQDIYTRNKSTKKESCDNGLILRRFIKLLIKINENEPEYSTSLRQSSSINSLSNDKYKLQVTLKIEIGNLGENVKLTTIIIDSQDKTVMLINSNSKSEQIFSIDEFISSDVFLSMPIDNQERERILKIINAID